MNGNGCWVQARGLPRISGHQARFQAAREIIAAHQNGELNASELTLNDFTRYLYYSDIPDTDLIIRTGGEWRLSNFPLGRAVSVVFWSTPVIWRDFSREHQLESLSVYRQQHYEDKK